MISVLQPSPVCVSLKYYMKRSEDADFQEIGTYKIEIKQLVMMMSKLK